MRSTKIKKLLCSSSSLWTCLHHMVIFRSQNKITDFFMILAWASPFNHVNIYISLIIIMINNKTYMNVVHKHVRSDYHLKCNAF